MIINRIEDLPKNPMALAIGTFDGVHRGHQKILEELKNQASIRKIPSFVLTFSNNPKAFIRKEPIPMVLSLHDKLSLIDLEGIDYVLAIAFDDRIRRMNQREFLEYLGVDVKVLVLGYDFHFGFGAGALEDVDCDRVCVDALRMGLKLSAPP